MATHNTNKDGRSFDEATKQAVWQKGQIVPGLDPAAVRKDRCGARMHFKEHGNMDSPYGWHVDHIRPKAAGGGDELSNLQPLNWVNNLHKGDDYPNWTCKVKHS